MCLSCFQFFFFFFFFFNDTATTEIYTLSLHDALPISTGATPSSVGLPAYTGEQRSPAMLSSKIKMRRLVLIADRKSTRLNSSHSQISYAVFCLKKKKKNTEYRLNYHDI